MINNLQYNFSFEEVKSVVKILRNKEVPVELECLYSCLESHIYSNMTIEEAEQFLDEK